MANADSIQREIGLIRREGLTVLSNPEDCEVDLVIIHGLNGHPRRTFYNDTTGFYWPFHLATILPTARIMIFGYIADASSGAANVLGVYQHSESLLVHLKNNRIDPKIKTRPMVLIGHSLGGLVLKQALILSSHTIPDAGILTATKLVCFLGTPHRGSHLLDKVLIRLGLLVIKRANKEVPRNVKPHLHPRADESYIVNSEFMRIKGQIAVLNFYEQMFDPRLKDLVVDKDSATFDSENSENIPLARDHVHLVRFEGDQDDAYHLLYQTLQRKISHILEIEANGAGEADLRECQKRVCIESLGFSSMSTNQSQEPHDRTLNWLWEQESQLLHWLRAGSGLFVVTGKPGSGKSFLISHVAKQIRENFHIKFPIIVHHKFNARGTPRERSLDGFCRSALVQILRQSPGSFATIYNIWLGVLRNSDIDERNIDNLNSSQVLWDPQIVKEALLTVTSRVSEKSKVCFIVDALDECNESTPHGTDRIVAFFEGLSGEAFKSTKENISICLSRRAWPDTSRHLVAGSFRMEEKNGSDIAAFVHDRWRSFEPLVPTSGDTKQLKTDLIRKADGIFLWAHLALEKIQQALLDGATVNELREAVNDIPIELEGIFALSLGNINPKFQVESNIMLSIVLAAQRPLDLREFRFALAASMSDQSNLSPTKLGKSPDVVQDNETMRRRISSRCGGLLELRTIRAAAEQRGSRGSRGSQTSVVQFMHQSVGEYLLDAEHLSATQQPARLAIQGHEFLARHSLRYLVLDEVQQFADHVTGMGCLSSQSLSELSSNSELSFLSYAAEFCFHHCEESEKGGTPQAHLIHQVFGSDDRKFDKYVLLFNMFHQGENVPPGFSLFHLAVDKNLASYADLHLLNAPADVDALLEGGQSSVQVAVSKQHLEMLKVLLKHDANVNLSVSSAVSYAPRYLTHSSAPYRFLPPLVEACRCGSADMVELLLEHGADVSQCTVSFAGMHVNQALLAAAQSGNIHIVQKLLESDPVELAHVDLRVNAILGLREKMEALSFKARNSSTTNMDAAAKQQIDIDVQRMRKISELLFEGININELQTASDSLVEFWFLTGCHHEVLERLRDAGTDFSGAGNHGASFFHAACLQGSVASLRLLNLSGGDVSIPFSSHGTSCLQLALLNESPGVLRCLLSEIKVQIDETDNLGYTALHMAARYARDEAIDILIANGADKSLKNSEGVLAFHCGILNRHFNSHVRILEKLLNQPSDVELPDRDGLTPLHMAAGAGAASAFEWLLHAKGASTEARDEYGRTVCHLAASCRAADSTDILELLLGESCQKMPIAHHQTPTAPIDVNERDSAGMSPLHHLFWCYDYREAYKYDFDPDVVVANARLLLRHGANLDARDDSGNTPLHLAAWKGITDAVRLFLGSGADAHAQDGDGLRPIDLAKQEEVRELLEDAMAV